MAAVVPFPIPAKVKARRERSVALTELRIEKLKATGQTYYVGDGKQPGLSVRVSSGGVKAFVFTKHRDGRLTRITLGRVGAMRLDDARRAVQRVHGDMALGIDVGAERRAAKAAQKPDTMQDAFNRFLKIKDRRDSTVRDYRGIWDSHVPVALKRKPVASVRAEDIENAKQALAAKHRTANKVFVLLAAVLSKAGRWADNPARGVDRYREDVRTRRLNPDELGRVWTALEREQEWGDFFRLLILTGSRRTPFCAMRWADLDLNMGVGTIPAEWAKSRREMAITLAGEAVRILGERRAIVSSCEWVWPGSCASGHVVNPEKPWRRVLEAAGVTEHATLHDVRRTLGSRLAMGGVAGATISKVLGHVTPQSLRAYAHLDVTAGREAIERTMAGVLTGGPASD